ncbi:MAG: hypothetical protein U0271_17795 [Polyangiaceae bacterium]
MAEIEPRILAAWREWLAALATNPEAAIAAAHVYGALSSEGRDAWLQALEEDAPRLAQGGVPRVALYAPLLSVEVDAERLDRIRSALANDPEGPPRGRTTALRGFSADRSRVAVLIAPLYAEFVQVLSCKYQPQVGFDWVRFDPIRRRDDVPANGSTFEGVAIESTPLSVVVEELAHSILAQRRGGREIPPSMVNFASLFDARVDMDTGG